ncbi:MAG: YfcC family protein [Alphaproteobacteria bacterium]|nr:YfcC family protein [Alphaproteobacteria bacterium]
MQAEGSGAKRRSLHPVVVMLAVLVLAAAITHVVGAGQYLRVDGHVVPGSYRPISKLDGLSTIFAPPRWIQGAPTRAAGILSVLISVPKGLLKNARLIFLVLMVGGMFGVLRKTGAIDAVADYLVRRASGQVHLVIASIMLVLALGSTFLGFISEYLVLIPIAALVGERLGYGPLFAVAVVGVAAKIGYTTSVTNPYALIVAQPIAGVPTFSGLWLRLGLFLSFIAIGIIYVIVRLKPDRPQQIKPENVATTALSPRHMLILVSLLTAGGVLIWGCTAHRWAATDISAFYLALALVFAALGGLSATQAADAFVEGLNSMMLAALLVGLAGAVQVLLQQSEVLDTLIFGVTRLIHGHARGLTANGIMATEMLLGVAIPSTAGKAAVSMPILAPIARLAGVSGQTSVLAFILGNGLTNMVTPTSGMLLAYLAAAGVGFGEWLRFIAPLFCLLLVISSAVLGIAVHIGY